LIFQWFVIDLGWNICFAENVVEPRDIPEFDRAKPNHCAVTNPTAGASPQHNAAILVFSACRRCPADPRGAAPKRQLSLRGGVGQLGVALRAALSGGDCAVRVVGLKYDAPVGVVDDVVVDAM
jgi:hypothetical protein